ncbi:dihydrodipicolinate synthase family protein [Nakamurella alba]|uniref:dihydrodipicolinate synthase family protein n=1 Tax=Nakamurella alba TaxID=2665158 RepID=UPI0012B78DAA|nr:dihydrodipicolinate synthase family protein [Nakamurella alba]
MNRNDVQWRGYWAAVPTPFDRDGEIDWPALDVVVEKFLDSGVHGLLANGSTGEWHSQTDAERVATSARIVEVTAGRVPVIVGCSSMDQEVATALAVQAKVDGADGIMLSPPPYLRPGDDEIEILFRHVASAAGLPAMVYNIPRRTGTDLSAALMVRLADIPEVVALKNSTTDDLFFGVLPELVDKVRVFGPNLLGARGVEAMRSVGGDGFIGGWELLGRTLPDFFESVWAGDLDRAAELGARERALDLQLWDEAKRPRFGRSFQSQLKASLNLIGYPAGYPRKPLLPLDDETKLAELAAVLDEFGLLVK